MGVLETLMQHNILEMADIVSNCIRWVLWKIVIILTTLVNGIEKAITKIYSLNGFFNSPEVTELINKYKPLIWVILAISIGVLGFKIMMNRKQNRGELPSNILFSILMLVLLPTLMIKLDNMTSIAVKDVVSEYTSSANELIKNSIYDLYYLDNNNFDLNMKNNINSKDILAINESETLESDEVKNKEVLGKKIEFDENGQKKLEDLDKGWLKIDEEYYRYGIDFLTIIVTLGAMGITLICIGLKVARLLFELAFNKLLATLLAFADISDGKKLKEVIKHIFSIFIVIFVTAIMTKLYVIFSSWLGTSLGNVGLSANGVAKLIVLVGGSIAVIDGPNIIERILGIDAGLKSGWSAVMAGYGLTKGTINGLRTLSDGAKSIAKTAALGGSMGVGALNGMFNKDKNNDNTNDNKEENKSPKEINTLEKDMNGSQKDNSNADTRKESNSLNNRNYDDGINSIDDDINKVKLGDSENGDTDNDISSNKLKELNRNNNNIASDLSSIEEEMNKADGINVNTDINKNKPSEDRNTLEQDIENSDIAKNLNDKNFNSSNGINDMKPDINKNKFNNNEPSNLEQDVRNSDIAKNLNDKNLNSNNGINNMKLDSLEDSNKNSIEGDMKQIKDISPNSTLNDEMGNAKNENLNNTGKSNSESSPNVEGKEINKFNGEKLNGNMENRTIGEYAKDKVKSSKFIDDINRSYNLGKNTTSKWDIRNKKNKK